MVRQDIKSWNDFKTRARVQGQAESGTAYSSAVTVYFANGTILKRRIEASDITSFWLASDKMTLHGERIKKTTVSIVKQVLFQLGHFPNNRVTMINQQDMKVHAQMDPKQRYKLFLEASLL